MNKSLLLGVKQGCGLRWVCVRSWPWQDSDPAAAFSPWCTAVFPGQCCEMLGSGALLCSGMGAEGLLSQEKVLGMQRGCLCGGRGLSTGWQGMKLFILLLSHRPQAL